MADFNLPTGGSLKADVLDLIKARVTDVATMSKPVNPPTDYIAWDGGLLKFVKWNGTAWVDLASSFSVNVASADKLSTPRNIGLTGDASGSASFDGSADASISVTVAQAAKLKTPRTITLGGDLTGNTSFDGSTNVTLTAQVVDDSHNHIIANVDGLQTALDGKLSTTGKAADSAKLNGVAESTTNTPSTIAKRDVNGRISMVGVLIGTTATQQAVIYDTPTQLFAGTLPSSSATTSWSIPTALINLGVTRLIVRVDFAFNGATGTSTLNKKVAYNNASFIRIASASSAAPYVSHEGIFHAEGSNAEFQIQYSSSANPYAVIYLVGFYL